MEVDWQALFSLSMSPLELIVRGSAMYWFLFLIFRFLLKRDVGAVGIADVLGQLAPVVGTAPHREAVLRQLGKVEETARAAGFAPGDETATLERIERARAAINRHP